jgi:hypothetical protein
VTRLHVCGVVNGWHVPALPIIPILRAAGCKQLCSVQRGGETVTIGLILTTDNGVFIDFFHNFTFPAPFPGPIKELFTVFEDFGQNEKWK